MENKVGDNVPTPKALAQLHEQLREVIAKLRAFGVTLDADSRRRLLHARLGAEPHVRRVHDLAVRYDVKLKHIPLDGMVADQALTATMNPLVEELQAGLTLAQDTAGQAESEAWEAFLAYYGVLSNMAERDPTLADELASVIEFMSNGPRKKKPEPK